MNVIKKILHLLKETLLGWNRSNALVHSAAIAFYTIFSMAPLVSFTLAISGLVASTRDVEPLILRSVKHLVGPPLGPLLAESIADYVESNSKVGTSGLAAVLSLFFFLFSASMVFSQLQKSLNSMWDLVPAVSGARINALVWLRSRLRGILAAAAISLFLLYSTATDILWVAVPHKLLLSMLQSTGSAKAVLENLVSPLLFWLIFAVVFKTFPMAKISWRDVWFGSGITALLFWLGNWGFDIYLRYFWHGSFYGKAGTLVIFLLWIYYSNALLLFGAKFTQVYAQTVRRPVVPHRDMTFR